MYKGVLIKISYWSRVIILGLVVGLGLQIVSAWSAPSVEAPGGSVNGPLTLSPNAQTKAGYLGVNGSHSGTYIGNFTNTAADGSGLRVNGKVYGAVIDGGTNVGVYGRSNGSYGVYGYSVNHYGVVGRPGDSARGGVYGVSQDGLAYGILGHANTYSLLGLGTLRNKGSVWSDEYCDYGGLNCFVPTDVGAGANPFGTSIDSNEITDGTIVYGDTNVNSVQRRVTGDCPAGESIRAISNTGTVTCEADDVGAGNPFGPSIDSNEITNGTIVTADTDISSVQRRVAGSCAVGNSIRAINANGTVTCEVDDSGSMTGSELAITLDTRIYTRSGGTIANNIGTRSASCSAGDIVLSVVSAFCGPVGNGNMEGIRTVGRTTTIYCDTDGNATFDGGEVTIACLNL